MHTVAGDDAPGKVGSVLKGGVLRCQYDVRHDGNLGVNQCRAVNRPNYRHLYLKQVGQQALALPIGHVPGLGSAFGPVSFKLIFLQLET